MSFEDINTAFEAKLNSISGLPDIAWPNDGYDPSPTVPYIRPTLITAEAGTDTVDYLEGHTGVYQIDIFSPLGAGRVYAQQLSDTIADSFALNNKMLTYNGVVVYTQSISASSGAREDSYWRVIMTIPYMTHIRR